MAGVGGELEFDSILLQLGEPNLVMIQPRLKCWGNILRLAMYINKPYFYKNRGNRLILLNHLLHITNSFSKLYARHRRI